MLPDFSKASSAYQPNKPFGGIATGDTGTTLTAALPSNNGPLNMTGKQIMGSGNNDSSLTNSYLNALKTQQGATAAAQSLSGMPTPDANPPETQAPTNGLSTINPTTPTTPPATALPNPNANPNAMVAGDNSRFANDPFKTNVNALR